LPDAEGREGSVRMFRGVSFRGAVRLGIVLFSAAAATVLLAAVVLAAKQWLDTVVFNQRYYASLKASQVDSFEALVERFEDDQLRWAPLLPPCEVPLVLAEQVVAADFASGGFSQEALKTLVAAERLGVAVYPVLVVEDPLTRSRVVTCGGSELARIPAPLDYDPLWPLEALCGSAEKAALYREYAPWIAAMFDSSRIVGRYALLPAEDLSHFVALISATASRKSVLDEASAQRLAMRTSVEELTIAGLEHSATGMTLTIAYPDDFTNGLDIFGTDDLIAYWWDLLGTAAVSTSATSIAWTDTDATNVASRYYRIGVGGIDGDEDGFADAREELMYHSDPEDADSYPVTVSGSVTHSNTPQTGPIYVVAVKASNSWDTGRSDVLASPGAFAVEGVPNLADYWIRAWRDWHPNGAPDPWEATGTATNCPLWLSGSVSNLAIALCDPPQSINGTLTYTGRQTGVTYAVAVLASNSMALTYSDALSSLGAYSIADLPQTTYWARAWIDADADGIFDADREASGAWTNNPFLLSNSVWDIDFSLADVDGDADGMPDWWELTHFGSTNQTSSGDYDADQMPNGWEYIWGFCPTNAADAMTDYDRDGYPNVYECKHDSNPHKAADGLPGEDDAIPAPRFSLTPTGATKIQAALDQATVDYDIILLAAGTYSGASNVNLRFPAHPVLLIGEDGAVATILDCGNTTRGVTFDRAQSSHAALARVTIRNGSAVSGGGILFASNTAATVYQCLVTNCVATEDGGAVYCDDASPTIRDCILTGNHAQDDGGALRLKDSSTAARVLDCVFDGNEAGDKGGALYCPDGADGVVISGTLFANNHAGSDGGAAAIEKADLTFEGCAFYTNTAANDGGAVHLNDNSDLTLSACVIEGNRAGADGGGVRCKDSSDPVLTDCTLSGNVAEDNGGGLFSSDGADPVVTNCLFSGNWAWDHGGGAYVKEGTAAFDSCTFSGNTAVDGAGIGCLSSVVSVVGCQIVDNWAHADGAGVRVKESDAVLRNCLIARNRSFGYGGGVNVKGATGRLSIENCTVVGNRTRLAGGGVAATEGGAATNANTILWGNAPDQASSGVASHHSCVQGGASGTGNLTNAPSMTPVLCRLLAGSPCIDSGTNAPWMSSSTDIDDEPRIRGTQVDIGADEFCDADSDGMADAWEIVHFGSLANSGSGDADGDGLSDAAEYAWDADPACADTDGDSVPDGADAAASGAPADAYAPDTLTLWYAFGDTNGASKSEKYVLSVVNQTNASDAVVATNTAYGAPMTGEYPFENGATYDISLVHFTTRPDYTNYPNADYDYQIYLQGQGGPTGWIFAAGFVIGDTNGIMGDHWEDEPTTVFDASNRTAQLYVLLTDIDVDLNFDGVFSTTEDMMEATPPGRFVAINNDDDNEDGTNDCQDVVGSAAVSTNEDDLARMPVRLGPTNLPIGTVVLEIVTGTNRISIWDGPHKGAVSNCLVGVAAGTNRIEWTLGDGEDLETLGDFPHTNFWVEGLTNSVEIGDVVVVFSYRDTNGVVRSADTNVLTVVLVDIAMDGGTNRNLQVNFWDRMDKDCLFWVNDDCDCLHFDWDCSLTFPLDFNFYYAEDDVCEGSPQPDCNDDRIGNHPVLWWNGDCRRDLEDFTRVHLYVDTLLDTVPDLATFASFVPVDGAPEANLFKAVTNGAGTNAFNYLFSTNIATIQKDEERLYTIGSGLVALEPSYVEPGKTNCFLLEGKTAGDGRFTATVKIGGHLFCERSVRLRLLPISRFYDIYEAGEAAGSGANWNVQVQSTADEVQSMDAYTPEADKYLLYVHGWNMTPGEKRRYGETIFKRLWWQRYNGRFGVFSWPTLDGFTFAKIFIGPNKGAHHYDNSEYIAWLSAESLKTLMGDLNDGGKLRILAHSMGNVVVGEALRRYSGTSLHRYVATQAAVSAHAWDDTVTGMVETGAWFAPFSTLETPNLYRDWYSGVDGSTNQPYFSGCAAKVSERHNYYNPDDYALGWWEHNNLLKPDGLVPYLFGYQGSETNYVEGVDAFFRVTNTVANILSVSSTNRYRVFAYCLESRSKSLGQTTNAAFNASWNMWDPPPAGMGYTHEHYYHSKQWRSSVDEEWRYYEKLRVDGDLGGLGGETP
jgi:parallel beta-helix repeat protein/predicted outer membrane repeat protein